MGDQKKCSYCGKILERRRYKSGTLEKLSDFKKRSFCDKRCSGKFSNSGKTSTTDDVNTASESIATGTDDQKKTAAEYLSTVVNDAGEDTTIRVNAAKALLPYQEKKAAEKTLGKKGERAAAAKEASGGKFSRMKAPRLVKG